MRRTLPIVGLTLLLVLLPGCVTAWHGVTGHAMLGQQVDHVPAAGLRVRTRNGRVQIDRSPDAFVEIVAKITSRAPDQATADARAAAVTLEIVQAGDDTLSIEPVFPGGWRDGDAASLTITTPAAAWIDVGTSNGGVTVTALDGPLDVTTSNGAITIHDHDGPATLETSNGRLTVTSHAGLVSADTSNGAVEIDLEREQTGPVDVATSNGRISVSLGPAFAGHMTLRTSNGRIHVTDRARALVEQRVSRTSASLTFAGEGPSSRLRTSNGSISVVVE